jgi:hypothetical protein
MDGGGYKSVVCNEASADMTQRDTDHGSKRAFLTQQCKENINSIKLLWEQIRYLSQRLSEHNNVKELIESDFKNCNLPLPFDETLDRKFVLEKYHVFDAGAQECQNCIEKLHNLLEETGLNHQVEIVAIGDAEKEVAKLILETYKNVTAYRESWDQQINQNVRENVNPTLSLHAAHCKVDTFVGNIFESLRQFVASQELVQ